LTHEFLLETACEKVGRAIGFGERHGRPAMAFLLGDAMVFNTIAARMIE
jgi:hypothetical protein